MTALISLACSLALSSYPRRKNKEEKLEMSQWWKKTLGQSLNSAGVSSFLNVAAREHHLALPHLSVPDFRWIDWSELERLGFRGVVLDKDNTLTAPYSFSLFPSLSGSLVQCQAVFPAKVAVFSNSAGLYQYDPDGSEARALEESIGGIHVIRHGLCISIPVPHILTLYFCYLNLHKESLIQENNTAVVYIIVILRNE
ncbi:hypothetical protein KSP40_PGU021921 [Platanthera guangdongensis]|uniref:Uncharacterized protein n=1 Tax=Platanthera guangdongensis TaxID=2320717 RepID=A0ABR2MAD7_9ASPA